MSVEKKVPQIRFKGFSGEWDDSEFSRIATRVSTQHQSRCLPCVEYEDIVAGKGRFNKDIHQKKTFKAGLKFEVNDVLFGKLRPYLKNWFLADFEGIAVGDFWVLRADNVASTFLFSLIQTNKFEFIANLSAGSKMPRSDWGLVSSSCFFVPKNISESDKIGNTFQKLDNLINQHQQKHDKLGNIKKAMLEKMFPKQGETIPEIRFKGFSGEWEGIELSDEVTFINGRAYSQEELLDKGKYTVLRVGNFYTNSSWYYSDLELGDKYYADNGDLLYTWSASFGPHIWNGDKVIYHYHIWKLELSENIDKLFLLHLLDYDRAKILSGSNGSTMIHITKSAMEAKKVFIPKKDEQIVIGNYFQKLDALIKQHQQQIIKLNNIKQACLSKMFV